MTSQSLGCHASWISPLSSLPTLPRKERMGRSLRGAPGFDRSRHEAGLARRLEAATDVLAEGRARVVARERAQSRAPEVAVGAGDGRSLSHAGVAPLESCRVWIEGAILRSCDGRHKGAASERIAFSGGFVSAQN